MNKFKNSFFYIGTISVFSVLIYWIIVQGADLEIGRNIVIPQSGKTQWAEFIAALVYNLKHPLAILLPTFPTAFFEKCIYVFLAKKRNLKRQSCQIFVENQYRFHSKGASHRDIKKYFDTTHLWNKFFVIFSTNI